MLSCRRLRLRWEETAAPLLMPLAGVDVELLLSVVLLLVLVVPLLLARVAVLALPGPVGEAVGAGVGGAGVVLLVPGALHEGVVLVAVVAGVGVVGQGVGEVVRDDVGGVGGKGADEGVGGAVGGGAGAGAGAGGGEGVGEGAAAAQPPAHGARSGGTEQREAR